MQVSQGGATENAGCGKGVAPCGGNAQITWEVRFRNEEVGRVYRGCDGSSAKGAQRGGVEGVRQSGGRAVLCCNWSHTRQYFVHCQLH